MVRNKRNTHHRVCQILKDFTALPGQHQSFADIIGGVQGRKVNPLSPSLLPLDFWNGTLFLPVCAPPGVVRHSAPLSISGSYGCHVRKLTSTKDVAPPAPSPRTDERALVETFGHLAAQCLFGVRQQSEWDTFLARVHPWCNPPFAPLSISGLMVVMCNHVSCHGQNDINKRCRPSLHLMFAHAVVETHCRWGVRRAV